MASPLSVAQNGEVITPPVDFRFGRRAEATDRSLPAICSEQFTGSTRARRPAWVDDELFPFESRFVELDGTVVHYVDEGRGPILLMLHGNPVWSFVYRDVSALLAELLAGGPDRWREVLITRPA